MKYIIAFFVFVFCTSTCTAQQDEMSIETLEGFLNMTTSQFEDWSLSRGYVFDEVDKQYLSFDILYYLKKDKSVIGFGVNKAGDAFGIVQYLTVSSEDYMKLKADCVKKGYKFVESKSNSSGNNDVIFHVFKKGDLTLKFNTYDQSHQYRFSVGLVRME